MSERKVLNKYFPPNFDPSKIPRRKKPLDVKDKRHKVRLMAPFSMQCETCREFIYKGKKFNAIKETVKNEDYLSLRIFRFYIRCPKCHAEITFKTDPATIDYVAERGAVRNYDPRRDEVAVSKIQNEVKDEEEEMDPLKALENRTRESKREMQILDALEEVRTRNARVERIDVDGLLERMVREGGGAGEAEPGVDEEDELDREAREAFLGVDTEAGGGGGGGALSKLRMAAIWSDHDEDGDGDDDQTARDTGDLQQSMDAAAHDASDDGDQAPQDEEDLDTLLLQYRLASSSSSSAPTASAAAKPKKRSHAEASVADGNNDHSDSLSFPLGAGSGSEWATLAKRVKTSSSSLSPAGKHIGVVKTAVSKPAVVAKQQAPPPPPPKPLAASGLLGLAYGDDDEDDSE